jgi:hypothetical protein
MSNSAGRIGLNKILLQDVAESRLARLVQTIRRLVAPVPSSDGPPRSQARPALPAPCRASGLGLQPTASSERANRRLCIGTASATGATLPRSQSPTGMSPTEIGGVAARPSKQQPHRRGPVGVKRLRLISRAYGEVPRSTETCSTRSATSISRMTPCCLRCAEAVAQMPRGGVLL